MKALKPDAQFRRILQDRRRAAVLALLATGALATTPALRSAEADPAAEETEEAEEATEEASDEPTLNWVELGVGGALIDGKKGAFRERTGLPDSAFGGISAFHYEAVVATNTVLKVDGRGIFDNHDYSLRLDLAREGVGYVRGGVQEFRTYSSEVGGYLPPGGSWYGNLFEDDLFVDRREYWVEAGLRSPGLPELTVRYSHQERDGRKNSTSWGEATTASGVRRITPSFLDLDETRDLVSLDGRTAIGKVDLTLGVRYERQDNDDTRNLRIYPGEAQDTHITQRDTTETDLFNVHGAASIPLNDKLRVTVGYAYTDLDLGATGYRVYGSGYDPDLADRLPGVNTHQELVTRGTMNQHVANVNAFYSIAKGLDLVPSLRVEQQDRDARSQYGAPGAPFVPVAFGASSDRGLLDVSEALELRYSGLTNVVFFAKGEWLQGSGDLDETWDNVSTGANLVNRSSDDTRTWQKYSLGANWYPLRRLSLGTGYYHKLRENDFDHTQDNTSNLPPNLNRYPAYLVAQSYTVDDVNVRATYRPLNNLTVVLRYDYQVGTLENEADALAQVESADMTSHIVSGSVSWVPVRRLYLQGRLSVVQDTTETPASGITASVQDSESDFWTGQLTAGFAASDEVDLEATYFYYRADNFSDNAAAGVPYGAGSEENGVTASVSWRVTPRIRWTGRYGFISTTEEMYGGHNDFDAHVLYSTIQYRF